MYNAFRFTLKALGMDHMVLPANYTIPATCLDLVSDRRSPDGATTATTELLLYRTVQK